MPAAAEGVRPGDWGNYPRPIPKLGGVQVSYNPDQVKNEHTDNKFDVV